LQGNPNAHDAEICRLLFAARVFRAASIAGHNAPQRAGAAQWKVAMSTPERSGRSQFELSLAHRIERREP
jgi:hypothetical protein